MHLHDSRSVHLDRCLFIGRQDISCGSLVAYFGYGIVANPQALNHDFSVLICLKGLVIVHACHTEREALHLTVRGSLYDFKRAFLCCIDKSYTRLIFHGVGLAVLLNASLAGAVYGIYKGEELIDTYTTDENGQFTTKYYICDNDWTVREISPSEGYLLDTAIHKVGAEPELYTVELNSTANDVNEQVIKGNIALIKHTDNGETQIETPEEGAVFEVFLKSAGSYENAKETERDVLTCDENGFAQTKDMPYGIYTVRQTSGWEGRELMKDFDVFISKDGQTYRYLINNANFESYIKIVKKDAETGNTIPYAGAGFQIYDPNGNLVTMTFTYPEVTTIDTFYTTADGDLITPQTLEYGKGYSLVEVQAPYGYVLNSEPVYFDVVQENSEEESGITVIEVVRSNMAQKGTITVEKSGEVFSSVAGDKGLYQPIFSVSGLEGAVYEITAAEDIVTLDGTVRANKGEVVDTVTTGKDGTVKSKELYLGKYEVKEITAPYGMVLNEEVRSVELVYAGQNVDVTETATSFYNERQRVEIDLIKSLAIDEAYGIGKNGEIFDVTFGLYAVEELTAADGKTIPADGLIEVISLDESGHGKAISDLPMGSYYVQEISTNSAYIVSDAKYPVTFEYAGQDTETVRITANEGEAITNDIIYGSVSGKKSDEDGKALGGAVIGIFTTGTTEFTKENAIAATTSKDDGSFSFAKVPYGTWIIREIESPKGYVLSEEEIAVTIGKVDEVVEIELVNYFIKGNIALTKVDEDYPDNKLSGAVFEVYSDTNGDGKLDKDDTLLGEMKELDGGVYQMSELRYGKYLVKETKAPTGFVLDENVYSVSVALRRTCFCIGLCHSHLEFLQHIVEAAFCDLVPFNRSCLGSRNDIADCGIHFLNHIRGIATDKDIFKLSQSVFISHGILVNRQAA